VTQPSLVALLGPASFAASALLALAFRGPRPLLLIRASALASYIAVVVAIALALLVGTGGTQATSTLGPDGLGLGLSLRLDALSVLIFGMVALLSVIVVRFSQTYLDGDPRQGVFLGRLCATIASVQLLVLSGNLALFFLAWVVTSLTLHGLLLFYRERKAAVIAARKKFIAARVGDGCILGAAVLLHRVFGTGDFTTIFAEAQRMVVAGAEVEVATVLLAIAAVLKSAQFPTHGWLIEVMETPTPVSALLHAGILNAGPFLVMRFASVMDVSTAAPLVLVLFGGFTALFASVVLLTQPTVKVALGYSSAAHMGFMLLVCGLGVYAAAVLHLVAHSFYKAHAFLSSGSVVESARAVRGIPLPARLRSPLRVAASISFAVLVYLGLALAFGLHPERDPALLAIGAILVMGLSQIVAPALDSAGRVAAMVRAAGLAVAVALAFFSLEEGARRLLSDALPPRTVPEPVIFALAMVVLVAFGGAVLIQILAPGTGRSGFRSALYVHLRNGLYANAAFDRLVGALRR